MKNPLDTANELVDGDRQKEYGHPYYDFLRTGKIWEGIFGLPVSPEQVALCMIGVKISRLVNTPGHKDSQDDIAGYIKTYWMVRAKREELEEEPEIEKIETIKSGDFTYIPGTGKL